MSVKDLFSDKNPYKLTSAQTLESLGEKVESSGNVQSRIEEKNRFLPVVNFAFPENFARYGKAEKYYEDAFNRISEDFPYDGSLREKTDFRNQSSYLDLYILDRVYPRTTGHAIFSPNGWGTPTATTPAGTALPSIVEYVQVKGGPNQAPEEFLSRPISKQFPESNKYDSNNNRESNLKFDFNQGVTVEFWMNKGDFISSTSYEIPFMLSNEDSGSLWIAVSSSLSASSDNSLYAIWTSGSVQNTLNYTGISNSQFTGSWHHFAFTFQNSGSDVVSKAYLDGDLVDSQTASSKAIEEVTGALKANIGAGRKLLHSTSAYELPLDGYGKLSGSIDEFRYWKTVRTSEQIGRFWFTDVGGGTNEDLANVDLGVYFKFNEGITGTSSIDSNVLDYSGRISNGTWTGYTAQARSTASAVDTYFDKEVEFKDPIIYSTHPDVSSLKQSLMQSGSTYDLQNNASIYNSIPSWIIEEDELNGSEVLNLTQIISSYFDTLHLQIQALSGLKDKVYNDPALVKPTPLAYKLLQSQGFLAPEIFADADVLAQILKRDEDRKYELDLYDIKNIIYQNIYNNLDYIYKTKGTEKSFRNLIRCFGVDEDLIRVKVYGNNTEYDFRDNYRTVSIKKRYADFNHPDRFAATVYQQTASANPNSVSYIEGNSSASYNPFTVEAEVIFPKKLGKDDRDYFVTPFLSASLFGFHAASSTSTDYTWPAPDTDLKVYAVRVESGSSDLYFRLEADQLGVSLETDDFYDVYDNEKWNLSVRIKPQRTGADLVSGSSTTDYLLEFTGYNADAGIIVNQFYLTASVSNIQGYTTSNKRLYLGAHRTNFTGSALEQTDAKISSLRYWASYLEDSTLKAHAVDPSSYGVDSPYESAFLYQTSLTGTLVPKIETLALNWDFQTVTSSDGGVSGIPTISDAGYTVPDVSSGSVSLTSRYKWLGDTVMPQHTGRGDFYLPDDTKVTDTKFVYGGIKTDPEVPQASDMINVIGESDRFFSRDTRPINYYYSIEKSMYQVISEEMLKMFSTILDFNTLVGDPINKYRQNYKQMEKLRSLFFEKVGNTPDFDKYIAYYKWLDESLGRMLEQLVPMSADVSDGIRTMIESHVLERNKYQHKLPTIEFKSEDPIIGAKGINDSLLNWKFYHHPVSNLQDDNCQWWNERAERTNPVISSGDAGVDADRQQILEARASALNRQRTTVYRLNIQEVPQVGGGNNVQAPKALDVARNQLKFGTTDGIELVQQRDFKDCTDELLPNEKRKIKADMSADPNVEYLNVDFNQYFPYTLFSSSVQTGYQDGLTYALENIHRDTYGYNLGTPMQGPFTETHVGGLQFRHVPVNTGSDDATTRPEAWKLTSGAALKIESVDTDKPRAPYYRDETAKRPLNIKNIKGDNGNYTKDYQIVQTNSRYINNKAWVSASGWDLFPEGTPSIWIAGLNDVPKIQRGRTEHVFVNRFSAPGGPETMGDSDGGAGLDRYSAEFSPNNDMNTRNIIVREDLNELLSSHVNQFGYFSATNVRGDVDSSSVNPLNYDGTGSIYQVNRNGLERLENSGSTTITASFYDNYFVQHAIPRPERDFTYNWSGSLIGDYMSYLVPLDAEALFGASSASISASVTQEPYIKTAYNGLNYTIYEPINPDTAFLGYETASTGPNQINYYNFAPVPIDYALYEFVSPTQEQIARVLNAITLKRQGPYGHPTWKQIRTGEHPLARYYRNNNQYTVTEDGTTILLNGQQYNPKYGSTSTFREMPINSKPGNLEYTFGVRVLSEQETGPDKYIIRPINVKTTFGNNISYFDNERLNQIADYDKNSAANESLAYDVLKGYYLDGALADPTSPIQNLVSIKYSERVYPSSINCYTFENRERIGYQNTFWRNARSDRNTLGELKFNGSSSQGDAREQSSWGLDGATQFDDRTQITTATPVAQISGGLGVCSAPAHMYESCSAGELQNDYAFCWKKWNDAGTSLVDPAADVDLVRPAATYARPQDMQSPYSIVNPSGMQFLNEMLIFSSSRTQYLNPFERGMTSSLNTGGNVPYSGLNGPYNVGLRNGDLLGYINGTTGKARFEAHELAGIIRGDQFESHPVSPFYDSYGDFNLEPRLKNQDFSVIPEFRISEEMDFYVNQKGGDFLAENNNFLKIPGTDIVSSGSSFYKDFSYSDFMKYFEVIREDHKEVELDRYLTLKVNAIKKFIPYDGFFPAERTLEIASYFSASYDQYITSSLSASLRTKPINDTLFSPGILFNTIKSGIAVDYPAYTSPFEIVQYRMITTGTFGYGQNQIQTSSYYAIGCGGANIIGYKSNPTVLNQRTKGWDYRVPFEALLDPAQYLNNKRIYNLEANPQIRNTMGLSVMVPAVSNADNLYKRSVSNFLAETREFFLSRYVTFSSKASDSGFNFESGSYGMRVRMRRSMEFVSGSTDNLAYFPQDGARYDKRAYETITMYSRPTAFGPPVAGSYHFFPPGDPKNNTSTPNLTGTLDRATNSDSLFGRNPSFTPPYYDGECWMDIVLELTESATLTLDQIFERIKTNNLRIRRGVDSNEDEDPLWFTTPSPYDGNTLVPTSTWATASDDDPNMTFYLDLPSNSAHVNKYAMKLDSSINANLKRFIQSPKFEDQKSEQWVIQTKFETPVLNFSDKTLRPLTLENVSLPIGIDSTSSFAGGGTLMACEEATLNGYGNRAGVPIGMWHQFGLIPQGEEGIYLSIEDLNVDYLRSVGDYLDDNTTVYGSNPENMKSLADILGFNKTPQKIGRLKQQKTVFEAVVAIPYFVDGEGDKKFFGLSRDQIQEAQDLIRLESDPTASPLATVAGDSIVTMVKLMNKYILPPKFDFLKNDGVDPFAMYIFEFSHTFDQDDLSYIWQNLTPRGGKKFEEVTATFSHKLDDLNLLQERDFEKRLRFMVFKVKQRGNNNYFSTIEGQSEEVTKQEDYSFNWPYDYFSLVEFAKMDCQIQYSSDELVTVGDSNQKLNKSLSTGLSGDKGTLPGPSDLRSVADKNKNENENR